MTIVEVTGGMLRAERASGHAKGGAGIAVKGEDAPASSGSKAS
jgi:hypothetical protein